jgi:serine protease inhibitor
VSPSSIYETLLIAYFGAGGQTEQELADVLVRNLTFKKMVPKILKFWQVGGS